MSQHGSGYGGYGGPPAGGPPGGAPPGYPPGGGGPGYPPGGGGPGYPPGGGAPPGYPPGGGAPPGYPPGGGGGGYPPGYGGPPQGGPGYGPPQGYAPAGMPGAPPPKKSNALMWVGLGCGGLFLLSAIGGGIAVYLTKKAAEEALATASSSFGTPITAPTDGSAPSTGAVSGACAKAVECCKKIIQKTNPGAQNEAGCLALKQLPEANCQLPLTTYQKSAQLLGLTCE